MGLSLNVNRICLSSPADIDEEKVLAAANQLVSLGLKDVGFEYVNIDVCPLFLLIGTADRSVGPRIFPY